MTSRRFWLQKPQEPHYRQAIERLLVVSWHLSEERRDELDQADLSLAEERERDLRLLVRLCQDRHASLLDDLVARELRSLLREVRVEDAAA